METEGKTSHLDVFNIKSDSIKEDQLLKDIPPSAHAIGNG